MGFIMIGTYYDNEKCMPVPNKKWVKLNSNFYRAIIDAEALIGGKATIVNFRSNFALVAVTGSNVRMLVTKKDPAK